MRFLWLLVFVVRIIWGGDIDTAGVDIWITFVLACLEIFRRAVWNIFRLENEHLNNCGKFRVCDDVPLPFETQTDFRQNKENFIESLCL